MSAPDPLIQVSVFIKGDALDPDNVTKCTGIEPSAAHRKGDVWRTSSSKLVTEKTGLWSITSVPGEKDVSESIIDFLSINPVSKAALDSIQGIEEAYVDIFVALDAEQNAGRTFTFDVDPACAAALARTGLQVQITVTFVIP